MANKQELLRRSAELIGKSTLAKRFRIPETLLDAWIRGDSNMPDAQLLRLAELLVELADPGRAREPVAGRD